MVATHAGGQALVELDGAAVAAQAQRAAGCGQGGRRLGVAQAGGEEEGEDGGVALRDRGRYLMPGSTVLKVLTGYDRNAAETAVDLRDGRSAIGWQAADGAFSVGPARPGVATRGLQTRVSHELAD